MAYFVKGNPTISKPKSLLGAANDAMSNAQKMRLMEKQQRQEAMLKAADMKFKQEQADAKLKQEAMKFATSENKRLQTQSATYQRELRRDLRNYNIEPWAEDYFNEVVRSQMAAANNFRGDLDSANAALDNIVQFAKSLEKESESRKKLDAFNNLSTDLNAQATANRNLKKNFQQIDGNAIGVKAEQANFLYNGGFATDMRLVGAGDLGSVPTLVGREFAGFDEQGNPTYGAEEIDVTKSGYYHDQGNTGYMVTPMTAYFGRSFRELGNELSVDLKRISDGGNWKEENARTFVGDLIRTPFGERGREMRMRSLIGNVTDPNNPEESDGIYYKYADNPELRDKLVQMVVDYDISDNNGLKPLYLEYRQDIEAALDLAEDKVVGASRFENYRAPSRSGGSTRNYKEETVQGRAPIIDEGGAIGSLYTPDYLRTRPISVSLPNEDAVVEFDAARQAKMQELIDERLASGSGQRAAEQYAAGEIDNFYDLRDRPDPTIELNLRKIAVFPDGVAEDGTSTLILLDDENRRYPISTTDAENWGIISNEIKQKTRGEVSINDLLNDMDRGWWDDDDPAVTAVSPRQEESAVEMTFVEWKAQQPEGADTSFTAYLAAMNR